MRLLGSQPQLVERDVFATTIFELVDLSWCLIHYCRRAFQFGVPWVASAILALHRPKFESVDSRLCSKLIGPAEGENHNDLSVSWYVTV
jgi:hypothetical protein